jgi:hypothetical protein
MSFIGTGLPILCVRIDQRSRVRCLHGTRPVVAHPATGRGIGPYGECANAGSLSLLGQNLSPISQSMNFLCSHICLIFDRAGILRKNIGIHC